MFGIDILTAPALLILAGGAQCPTPPPTKINVTPKTTAIVYDKSQSLREIQQYSTDTIDPYGFHGRSITNAFAISKIAVKQSVKLGTLRARNGRYGCIWYDEINLEIGLNPKIVIAKELYQDLCMRKAVLGHEHKHVRVDREAANKYAKIMGQKLYTELKSRGFAAGPVAGADMEHVAKRMQETVNQIISFEQEKMSIEIRENQRKVDTREEYDRVGAECPNFNRRKAQLYEDALR